MTSGPKHVRIHLDAGVAIDASFTDEDIMMVHKVLANTEAVLHVDDDGSRYLIPVRRIVTIEVVKDREKAPIPPPVAPDSVPSGTFPPPPKRNAGQ